MVSEETAKL